MLFAVQVFVTEGRLGLAILTGLVSSAMSAPHDVR